MTISLTTIPAELLDAILSIGQSQGTLNMWLTGDRAIQRQIALGVTYIDLQDDRKHSLSRLPLFILNLPKLRSLTIDRDFKVLHRGNQVKFFVRKLPPTLTTLRLRFRNSAAALAQDNDEDLSYLFETEDTPLNNPQTTTSDDDSSNEAVFSSWKLSSAFPKLSVLEMSDRIGFDFATLPTSLTDLTTDVPPEGHDLNDFAQSLPRQLLHLKLTRGNRFLPCNLWRFLPPGLQTLNSWVIDGSDATDLQCPPTLTTLATGSCIRNSTDLAALPSSLTSINDVFDEDFDSYDEIATILPRLRSLAIPYMPIHFSTSLIRNLPSNLTSVVMPVDMGLISASDWPSSLTSLSLTRSSINFNIGAVPPNLTFLRFFKPLVMKPSDMSRLPQSLTELNCVVSKMVSDEWTTFPPRLKSLFIIAKEAYITIERDTIEFEYTTEIQRHFKVPENCLSGNIVRMPFNENKFLRRFLEGEKVVKCFPFDALPRSLTSFDTNAIIPFSKLRDLPPHLTRLGFDCAFRDADCDFHTNIAPMLNNMQIGRRNGIIEKSDFSHLQHATLSSMLPRSLTEFSALVIGHKTDDYQHLPPNITELALYKVDPAQHIDSAMLFDILKLDLKVLSVGVQSFTDEHCKALSRNLLSAYFPCDSCSQLTSRGALFTPPCSEITVRVINAPNFLAMQKKRQLFLDSYSVDTDHPTFLKLFNAHENVEFCHELVGISDELP